MPSPAPSRAAPAPLSDNARGALWMLFSVVNASAMTVAARWLSEGMDSRMVVFSRAALTLIALAPLLAWPRFRALLRFSRPRLHLARGAMVAVSTQFGFYAIAHLPLANVTVLFFTAPIFATLLAGPINGERVGPRRWAAVAAGFSGALIILRPGLAPLDLAMAAALGSSLLFATTLALSRRIAAADGPVAAYVSSVAMTAALGLPLALAAWTPPGDGAAVAALAVLVIAGAARGMGDIQAYRHAEASVVGVIAYLRLVLIGGAGWLIFDEGVDRWTLTGGAVIIGASLYIARREALRGRAAAAPKAGPAD